MSWEDLPSDLIHYQLSLPKQARLVCRHWSQLPLDGIVYNGTDENKHLWSRARSLFIHSLTGTFDIFLQALRLNRYLQKVTIEEILPYPDAISSLFQVLATKRLHLLELNLHVTPNQFFEPLIASIQYQLNFIVMEDPDVLPAFLSGLKRSSISSLELGFSYYNPILVQPTITSLKLWLEDIPDDFNLGNLEILELSGILTGVETLSRLLRQPNRLHTLYIKFHPQTLGDADPLWVGAPLSIRRFKLSGVNFLNSLPFSRALPQLEELTLEVGHFFSFGIIFQMPLKKLDLSNSHLFKSDILYLTRNNFLQELSLEHTTLRGAEVLIHIFKILGSSIRKLSLANNNFNDLPFELPLRSPSGHLFFPHLISLDLRDTLLSIDTLRQLFQLPLEILLLGYNILPDNLFYFISKISNLRKLDLSSTRAPFEELGQYLAYNTTLEILNLTDDYLSPEAVQALVVGLRTNNTLRELDLSYIRGIDLSPIKELVDRQYPPFLILTQDFGEQGNCALTEETG